MATRVNTKFVIVLAAVLVVMVGGGGFAVMKYMKDAADYAEKGERMLQDAEQALADGDLDLAKRKLDSAKMNFGAAANKDARNTEYRYKQIAAIELMPCTDLTLAGTELKSILGVAVAIHDTPGASEEDREYLYQRLLELSRMGPAVTRQAYPLGVLKQYADKWLITHPNDQMVQRYAAIAGSYGIAKQTSDPKRQAALDSLNQSIQVNDKDPWLYAARARYHVGNAYRLYFAAGSEATDEVNATFYLALQDAQRAASLAAEGDDPAGLIEALTIGLDLRTENDANRREMIAWQIQTARQLYEMLQDKPTRDKLYTEEMSRAIRMIATRGSGTESDPFDGKAYSLALAKTLVGDRPEDPTSYAVLGSLYSERQMMDEATRAIEQGLAIDRLTNAVQFIVDQQARLDLLSTAAEVKVYQAQRTQDKAKREALLVEAAKHVEAYAKAQTVSRESRDAMAQFLRGWIDLVYGRTDDAIRRMEKANAVFNDSHYNTLRYLALAHAKKGQDGKLKEYYERMLARNPMASSLRMDLIKLYLNQPQAADLAKAAGHITFYLDQSPGDIQGIIQRARLLSERGQRDEAIALLQAQDLEAHPEVKERLAIIQGESGNNQAAAEQLRELIHARAEGEPLNMSLVQRLLSTIPTLQGRLTEVQRLVDEAGLPANVADVLTKSLRGQRLTLEEELAYIESQGHTPAMLAIQKYLVYARWGKQAEAARELARAEQIDPNQPVLIALQFRAAMADRRWADAELAVDRMMALDADDRLEMAIGSGAFMRADILTARAAAMSPGPGRDKALREAAAAYNKALQEYNHYVEGWLQLARVQMLQKNYFAAQESLGEVLDRDSRNIRALLAMAQAETATDNEVQALQRYKQVLDLQPNNSTVLDQFSDLAKKVGTPREAITQREQIRRSAPSNTQNRRALALLYAEDLAFDKARQEIDGVIALEGKSLQNLMVLSRVMVLNDQNEQAVQEVNDYLASRGADADWRDHLLMAQTYEWVEQHDRADAAFAKAAELEGPGSAQASLAWGLMLQERGETAKAAALYERLIQSFPDNQTLKLQTAQVYLSVPDFAKAEAIAKTLAQSPERYQLLIQSALGQNQLGMAVQRAREGVEAFPENFGLRTQLGRLLLGVQERRPVGSRDYSEAEQLAKRLLADFPDRADAQLLMADVLLANEKLAEAVTQLEKVLEFAPSHLPANERLYSIRLGQAKQLASISREASRARAAEALGIAVLLIKARPDLPLLQRRAGEAAELAGQPEKAVTYFRTAFDMSDDAQDLASYANALLVTGKGADARSVLEDPDHIDQVGSSLLLKALRGRALAASGEPDMAAALFRNILASTEDPAARDMLVRQLSMAFTEDPDRAVMITEQVMGKDLPVGIDSVLAALMSSQKQYAKAASRLTRYEIDPIDDPRAQFQVMMQLGLAWQQSGQYEAAKKTYEQTHKLVQSNPGLIPMHDKVHLLNNLAYLLADELPGYESDAVRYAQQALDLLPSDEAEENVAQIEDTLGWALYKAGRIDDAISVLRRSVDKYALAANQLHLGRAYLSKGKPDQALLVLQAAVRKAESDGDKELAAEADKWHQQALRTN